MMGMRALEKKGMCGRVGPMSVVQWVCGWGLVLVLAMLSLSLRAMSVGGRGGGWIELLRLG